MTKSVSSFRSSTDSSPRSSALERFKGWAQRLSCVSEDSRVENGCKEKGKMPVGGDDDDDDDDDDWDFRCKGDPDDPLTQRTIEEEH